MSSLKVDVVTAEGRVFSGDADVVVAPGVEGQLGILPHHAPLMTMLQPGTLMVRKGGGEVFIAVSGGFLEVRPDQVIILVDAAERAENIDAQRAEEAKKRAEERLKEKPQGMESARTEAALRRALVRLDVVKTKRKRKPGA